VKVYKWFRSPNRALVDRCASLYNTMAQPIYQGPYPVRARVRETLDGGLIETDPPLYGFPVDAGSEANDNPGAALFAAARASIPATEVLTPGERDELLNYCAQEEDIEHDWWSNPESPDFGPLLVRTFRGMTTPSE